MLLSFTLFMSVLFCYLQNFVQSMTDNQQQKQMPKTPQAMESERITIGYTPTRHRSVTNSNINTNRSPQSPHSTFKTAFREEDYFSLDMGEKPPPPTSASSPHARSILTKQPNGQRGIPTVRSPSDIYYAPQQNPTAHAHRLLPSSSAASIRGRHIPPFSAPAVIESRDRLNIAAISCPFCAVTVPDVQKLQEHLNVHKAL